VLAPLVLATSLAAQADDDTALAPANTWYALGGCAARSGGSRTELPPAPLERDWTVEPGGSIEGEPLVWNDLVVIATCARPDQRTLSVLDLATGRTVATQAFHTDQPLEPSLWGAIVLVRSSPTSLSALRVDRDALTAVWEHQARGPLSSPLLVHQEVFVLEGSACKRLSLSRPGEEIWRTQGPFRGRLAVRGDEVAALVCADVPRPEAWFLSGDDGEVRQRHPVSGGIGRQNQNPVYALETPDDVTVAALAGRTALVRSGTGASKAPAHCRGLAVSRTESDAEKTVIEAVEHVGRPAALGADWFGLVAYGKDAPQWALVMDAANQFNPLEIAGLPAEENASDVEPTGAGSLALIGGLAVDPARERVAWRLDVKPSVRAIPARDRILFVEEGSRLVAWRGRRPNEGPLDLSPPPSEGAAAAARDWAGATAVLEDGSVVGGTLHRAGTEWQLLAKGGKPSALQGVVYVEDSERRPLWASSAGEVVHALDRLAENAEGQRFATLAEAGKPAGDGRLMLEMLLEAEARRPSGVDLAKLRAAAELVLARSRKTDAKAVASLREQAAAIRTDRVATLWSARGRTPPDRGAELRARLLRETLRRDPLHPEATAAVRATFPDWLSVPKGLNVADWIAPAMAASACGLARVTLPPEAAPAVAGPGAAATPSASAVAAAPEGAPAPAPEDPVGAAIVAARASWPEVLAFRTPRTLIVTPPDPDLSVLRCAQIGELACSVMETLYARGPARRAGTAPLVFHLAPTIEKYRVHTVTLTRRPVSGNAISESIAGDEVISLWLPADPAQLAPSLRWVVADAVGPWLARCCPRFEPGPIDSSANGYWACAGLYELVSECAFDLEQNSWRLGEARGRSAQRIAAVPKGQLMNWATLFTVSWQGSAMFSGDVVPLESGAGDEYLTLPQLFYAQAGAAVSYLYHVGGDSKRQALLDLAAAYAAGRSQELDAQALLGASWADLGAAVEAWARGADGP
jgi:hypothetical protein